MTSFGEETKRKAVFIWWLGIGCVLLKRGGAGIRRLHCMNQALLCKWLWRFGESKGSFWRSVVATRYGVCDNWTPSVPRWTYGCGPWRGILKYLPVFSHGLVYEVGNGIRIKF